jgi:hypothetical protein
MSSFSNTSNSNDGACCTEDSNTKLSPSVRPDTTSSIDSVHHLAAGVMTSPPSCSGLNIQLFSGGHAAQHNPPTSASYNHLRPYPPPVYINAMNKPAPSLTSSTSYSSLSTGRYTFPITPTTSSSEFLPPCDPAIVNERHLDDTQFSSRLTHREFFAHTHEETQVAAWPQQKPNIFWAATRATVPTDLPPFASISGTETPLVSLQLPPVPNNASPLTLSRFLSRPRKRSTLDAETQAQTAERKRLNEEKRARKEEAKVIKEKARLDKLKRDLRVNPLAMVLGAG